MTFTQSVDNHKTVVIRLLRKQFNKVFIALRSCNDDINSHSYLWIL